MRIKDAGEFAVRFDPAALAYLWPCIGIVPK